MYWRIFFRLIAAVGLQRLRHMGARLGALVYRQNGSPVRITGVNLRLVCPQMDEQECEKLKEQAAQEFGSYMLETFYAWGAAKKVPALCQGIEGLEPVRECLQSARGALLLTPHFGCTELSTMLLSDSLSDYSSIGLYRTLKPPSLYGAIAPVRFGPGTRAMTADMAGLRQVRRTLKDGGFVMMAPDVVPRGTPGELVEMMGIPVRTSVVPIKLMRSTGAALFIFCGLRTESGFRVIIRQPSDAVNSDNMVTAMSEVHRQYEALIRMDMKQGHWFIKRYSSNPDIRREYRQQRDGT